MIVQSLPTALISRSRDKLAPRLPQSENPISGTEIEQNYGDRIAIQATIKPSKSRLGLQVVGQGIAPDVVAKPGQIFFGDLAKLLGLRDGMAEAIEQNELHGHALIL